MPANADAFDHIARFARDQQFSGVVRIDAGDDIVFDHAFGSAHRAFAIPNRTDTRFAMASGSKTFAAVAVMSLVAEGVLALDTTARSLLGDVLPLIDDAVTVEHLLTHRSGIGDYLDEDTADSNEVMFCVGTLADTADFVPLLDGHPTKFAPGSAFSYCNGGFVVLALLIELATGQPFHQVVDERVFHPAGMHATGYLRSDELPGDAAIGYVDGGPRTNVFHLPVRGSGDGGAYTTTADTRRFWDALMGGRLVPTSWVDRMVTASTVGADDNIDYGMGVWLDPSITMAEMHGFDAGASFVSGRHLDGRFTYTLATNAGRGGWAMRNTVVRTLASTLGP